MAENSLISWTRHTWNPWMGCTKVSPACDGCYAEALMDKRYGKVQWGNAPRVRTGAHTWNDPIRWQRQAEKAGDRPFVFCASLSDIFDNQVDPQWRAEAFEVMRKTPNLVYLLLTKRPQNIVDLADDACGLPCNAAIGTTVEDQRRVELNVPHLMAAKAILRPLFSFVSCEPLIGPINLHWIALRGTNGLDALRGVIDMDDDTFKKSASIDWVITGGETDQGGHKARPTHPNWFRSLRDQCADAGVPFHHKQNGEWVSVSEVAGPGAHFQFEDGSTVRKVGKKLSGRMLDGVTHNAFPEVANV